jgi:Domain of unknown function (DUF1707)/Cell wall-active antibiotics response 4TMS YvqF
MTSPHLPLAIGTARERTIERLSTHFANDRLTIDELDVRLERAYAATSLAELDALTADLPGARLPAVDESALTESTAIERYEGPATIRAIMSETRRGGLWVVPPQLDLKAVMANITLDLRSAMLSPGITDVDVTAIMASVNILLPPGVRVIENLRAFMASVTDDSYSDVGNPSAPVIRLTGRAFMSEVKVRTKSHRTVE